MTSARTMSILSPSFRAAIFILLLLALLLAGRSRMFRDPGALWHTVVGERILDRGALPSVDEFSFTFEGHPWIAQQWLAECIMAAAHRAAGLDSLLLAAAALLAAIYAGIGDRLYRAGFSVPGVILLLAIVLAASSHHFHARPHIATIALTALTYGILCDVEAGRAPARRLWLLPLLMVLWTNLHGGALAGIVNVAMVLIGWAFLLILGRRQIGTAAVDRRIVVLIVIALLSAATIWVNPYGGQLPRVWIALMGSKLLPMIISEHGPLRWDSVEGVMVIALFVVYVAVLSATWRRMLRITWLLPLLWFLLAVSRVRHAPLFAVLTAISIAEMFPYSALRERLAARGSALFARHAPSEGKIPMRWAAIAWPAAIVLIGLALQVGGIRVPVIGAGWAKLDETYWPVAAAAELPEAMREAGDHRVFNPMLYGGYLIYAVPEACVYIDDRCELYGEEFLREFPHVLHDAQRLLTELDAYELRLAIISTQSAAAEALRASPTWTIRHQDPVASVFFRR